MFSKLQLPSASVIARAFCLEASLSKTQIGFCVFKSMAVIFPEKLPQFKMPCATAIEQKTRVPVGSWKIDVPVLASKACRIPWIDVPR